MGAGIAGLCCALELAEAGVSLRVIDRASGPDSTNCSWFAGGMLAPYCEGENAHAVITSMGVESMAWWRRLLPADNEPGGYCQRGSLVVAQGRDRSELRRFAKRSRNHHLVDGEEIAVHEPDLAGRFESGLFFSSEAHINPRSAMGVIRNRLRELGVEIQYGVEADEGRRTAEMVVDCRGLAARDHVPELRGVKGEMLVVACPGIVLSRPVRLLHPRIPLYIVPRGEGVYMVGATVIESDERNRVSARSIVELLQGAYALHPAFMEAEILELGTEVRPAMRNNLPVLRKHENTIFLNGLYRHGFLVAPTLAQWVREWVMGGQEPCDPMYLEMSNENSM